MWVVIKTMDSYQWLLEFVSTIRKPRCHIQCFIGARFLIVLDLLKEMSRTTISATVCESDYFVVLDVAVFGRHIGHIDCG